MTPYRIEVPQSTLDDLRDRLRRTRWPEAETVDDWSQGVPLRYLQRLCAYWAGDYNWRVTEARLNRLPQYRVELDGLGIHVAHVRSPHPDALPLVLTNGWPGSLLEYLKVIGPLTDPPAHGGNAADAFHLVLPTLPGYGFSDKPERPGWTVQRVAGAWAELMTRLGYERYGAQGSDWGTSVTSVLGRADRDRVAGILLVPPLAGPDPATLDDLTEAERAALAGLEHSAQWESGYSAEQASKPQTVGYSLVDSPVGLCAWIVEKYRSWMDCAGDPETVLTRDELLDAVMMYWLPGTGASSARLYWESIREVSGWFRGSTVDVVDVPTGGVLYPKELPHPSRRWAQRRFPDLRYWSEPAAGGHFAALEQPVSFVDETRAFFRLVR